MKVNNSKKGYIMMKKGIKLILASVYVVSMGFASESEQNTTTVHTKLHFSECYEPIFAPEYSENDHEHKVCGSRIDDLISSGKPMHIPVSKVFVAKKHRDGSFGKERDITTFSPSMLKKIYENDVYYDWSGQLQKMFPGYSEEISFVQGVKKGTCVLCKFDQKQIIITDAEGTAQQECAEYIRKTIENKKQ
jgi:hypothetical protein